MLFITPTSGVKGAKDYFTRQLAAGDYYARDGEEFSGHWNGLGAQLLGLQGEVAQQDFFALCDNRNPATGERLTPRTKDGRRIFYDFSFTAPKEVTLAYELGGDERVLEAFRASVAETMDEMEADMHGRVRARGADSDRRTANMVWAEFVHRTARPVDGMPDPSLHCHAVAFNATFDSEEGRWKAAQFGNLVRDKGYYQAAFHARLAERLHEMGYGIRREGTSFALAGIDRALVQKFSRRSAVIDAAAQRMGVADPQVKAGLGRLTREAKLEGHAMAVLKGQWQARLTDAERKSLLAARGAGTAGSDEKAGKAAFEFALAHCFERASVVTEKGLVAQALMNGVGRTNVGAVWAEAKQAALLRRVAGGEVLATTREVHREELAVLAFAREGRGEFRALGAGPGPGDATLTAEQGQAAMRLLTSRDRVTLLRGGAGTGKTHLMRTTVAAIEAAGKQVFTFAPSAKASRGVLREEGFASADTVEKLLTDPALHRAVRGQVVWIDEAGLMSMRDMKRVFDLAGEAGFRIVLSGDSAQHGAVARGEPMRLLERGAGVNVAKLTTIRRQTNEQYRAAVGDIAAGEARDATGRSRLAAGIDRLDRMGAIVTVQGNERLHRLAADYAEVIHSRPGRARTALVVSPTHREGDQVARAIRDELWRTGALRGKERNFLQLKAAGLTGAQRGCSDSYRVGQIVRFHQNAPGFLRGERVAVTRIDGDSVQVRHGDGRGAFLPLRLADRFDLFEPRALSLAAGDRLRITLNGFTREVTRAGAKVKSRLSNGDMFEVAGFTRQGDIRLTNGFVVPKDYGGIAQGYVVTSHASQGSTVDTVLIALGAESLAAANRQQFYVSVSRGREAVRLYTDDKQALKDAVQLDAARMSATELLQGKPPKKDGRDSTEARLMRMRRERLAYEGVLHRAGIPAWQAAASHCFQPQEARHGRG